MNPTYGRPALQFTGVKGSADNVLVLDTIELEGSMLQLVRAVLAARAGHIV